MNVESTWISTWHQMDHVSWSLGLFSKPPLEGRPNTKPGDHGTPKVHNSLVYFILSCVRTRMNRNSLKGHFVEGPITYDFTLHLKTHDRTTWFWKCLGTAIRHFLWGSHNFMVTGSWLVCEVALNTTNGVVLTEMASVLQTFNFLPHVARWILHLFAIQSPPFIHPPLRSRSMQDAMAIFWNTKWF
jgi:hypothetical protein